MSAGGTHPAEGSHAGGPRGSKGGLWRNQGGRGRASSQALARAASSEECPRSCRGQDHFLDGLSLQAAHPRAP